MEKRNLLYIMGIDWKWIYQRPQILAEMLGEDYDVTVVFPRFFWQRQLPEEKRGLHLRPLWKLPFQERYAFIAGISDWINKRLFADINRYDYIYLGYPLYARYIDPSYQGKIIYDCMDNYEALYPLKKSVGKLNASEEAIVKKCELLIVSSEMLRKKMDKIAGFPKSILIRNGMFPGNIAEIKSAGQKEMYHLCYIGTIASWFDGDVIRKSLEKKPNIQYQLIGPYEEKIEDVRIVYHGPIKHDQLYDNIKDYDCLIMPFKINDIVEAVDPVKLYEYIAFGKCIISVYYDEIERFSEFVYFYRTEEEYVSLLDELEQKGFPPKYDKEQQERFLQENTWEQRYQDLKKEIDRVEEYKNED